MNSVKFHVFSSDDILEITIKSFELLIKFMEENIIEESEFKLNWNLIENAYIPCIYSIKHFILEHKGYKERIFYRSERIKSDVMKKYHCIYYREIVDLAKRLKII